MKPAYPQQSAVLAARRFRNYLEPTHQHKVTDRLHILMRHMFVVFMHVANEYERQAYYYDNDSA